MAFAGSGRLVWAHFGEHKSPALFSEAAGLREYIFSPTGMSACRKGYFHGISNTSCLNAGRFFEASPPAESRARALTVQMRAILLKVAWEPESNAAEERHTMALQKLRSTAGPPGRTLGKTWKETFFSGGWISRVCWRSHAFFAPGKRSVAVRRLRRFSRRKGGGRKTSC